MLSKKGSIMRNVDFKFQMIITSSVILFMQFFPIIIGLCHQTTRTPHEEMKYPGSRMWVQDQDGSSIIEKWLPRIPATQNMFVSCFSELAGDALLVIIGICWICTRWWRQKLALKPQLNDYLAYIYHKPNMSKEILELCSLKLFAHIIKCIPINIYKNNYIIVLIS